MMRSILRLCKRFAFQLLLIGCIWVPGPPLAFAGVPSVNGLWEKGPNFPFFPVHIHLLPNGKLMIWPGDEGISGNDPRSWDPATGLITQLSKPGYDIFCSGHLFLPDGRLFVAGGHIQNSVGLNDAAIYDPAADRWTRQPDMNLGRWYPTTQLLPNGDVVVISGDVNTSTGANPLPQVWQSATGTWRNLTNAQLKLPLYPYLFLAPNGKVFNAGPSIQTRYLDTAGTGDWTFVTNHVFTSRSRTYGSAVMYQPGKILSLGGGDPPTAVAEVIDLNVTGTPRWRSVAQMTHARRQMNATVLPDGQVLVTGGTKGAGFNNSSPGNPIFAAELWNPSTEKWTLMEEASVPRLYHSAAILMPDGRVMTTGGNGYTQTEFFSPPYLFAGSRPQITRAPSNVGRGQRFFIETPDAGSIDAVSFNRLGSVTHTTDMNQGVFRTTAITRSDSGITITAPNLTTVPNGHYMLFLLSKGVPSIAKIVRLDASATNNPVPVLASITPTSATAGGGGFTLTANGSGFNSASQVRWNGQDRPTTFVSSTQLRASISASDIANAGTAQVTVFNPAPGGGTSAAQTFTIISGDTGASKNLAPLGNIIARVPEPTGGGSKNIEIIRDGVKPAVGSTSSLQQYDTYDGANTATDDWIGYQFSSTQNFSRVVFQEGRHFGDGGWFTRLTVQVLQNGSWVEVSGLSVTPTYPNANNNTSYETYTLQFTPVSGNGIRIYGEPGGNADFISVGEIEVYGDEEPPSSSNPVPSLSTMTPTSATAGGGGFTLTANGSGFNSASQVRWNGQDRSTTFVSSTQLRAAIPASDIAAAGTAQVTVFNPSPGGGTSAAQIFTITSGDSGTPENLAPLGNIIARVATPTGGGSKDIEIIRDGVKPAVGSTNSLQQYDTYDGANTATEDWIGYQFSASQNFSRVVFQEGRHFGDGGWFTNLTVQVLQAGAWVTVSDLSVTPTYPNANNNTTYETYNMQFAPVSGTAIRIFGEPGGSADFISVSEIEVYGE
jgi:hypothetical protein